MLLAKSQGFSLVPGVGLPDKQLARAGADIAAKAGRSVSRWPGVDTRVSARGVNRRALEHRSQARPSVGQRLRRGRSGPEGDNQLTQNVLEEHIQKLDCLWDVGGDFNLEFALLQSF